MVLRGHVPVPPWLDSMEIQPEDIRVPSDDSSPTQAPPDDALSHPETLDPTLLLSIPRSENQYNEDFNDYTRQVHNSPHGDWPVSEPIEEWKCRRFHSQRFWFYRAWFHHRTLPWDHNDIAFFKSSTGYFIDDHPASHWPNTFSRIWGTRGWQLVLSATMSLDIWNQCQQYEDALRQEEERIAAEQAKFSAVEQLEDNPVPRRGLKRQARENLEHLSVQYQVEALLHNFQNLDVSQVPMLQGLPPNNKMHSSLVSFTASLLTVKNSIKFAVPMISQALPLPPHRLPSTSSPPWILSALALVFTFLYLIQDLYH